VSLTEPNNMEAIESIREFVFVVTTCEGGQT